MCCHFTFMVLPFHFYCILLSRRFYLICILLALNNFAEFVSIWCSCNCCFGQSLVFCCPDLALALQHFIRSIIFEYMIAILLHLHDFIDKNINIFYILLKYYVSFNMCCYYIFYLFLRLRNILNPVALLDRELCDCYMWALAPQNNHSTSVHFVTLCFVRYL